MKIIKVFFLSTIVLLTACSKIDELTQFNLTYDVEVIIPSGTPINLPFNLISPDITTNSNSTFSSNNTSKNLIEEINLIQLTLELTSPSDGNLNFLKEIELFINAQDLPDKKIAWKYDIQNDGVMILYLDTSSDDLQDYIKKDEMTLSIKTTTDEIMTQDHTLKASSIFYVDAKILGI